MKNKDKLKKDAAAIGVSLNDDEAKKFEEYQNLLLEWNEKINLTAITKKEDVYLKHFYDSLTMNKIVDLSKVETMCDIGTGAGFPGLVIKIAFPNIKMTLVDALEKRIKFLNEVIKELGLTNIETVHARSEEYAKVNRNKFDITTARAVAHLSVLLEYAIPMTKVNGNFIAMKANVTDELDESKNALSKLFSKITGKIEFELPNENGQRTIIKIEKNKDNNLFPRKYAEIKKKRL
jgi:16S rRNA (guanine527-N7)-methyltransferase